MQQENLPLHLRYEQEQYRRRYLYALIFKHGPYCYIGQTVNPKRRHGQHRNTWGKKKFSMHILNSIQGNKQEAEEFEYAWRYVAYKKGFNVYGLPPDIVVNPELRMNSDRLDLVRRLKWPRTARQGGRLIRFLIWLTAFVLAGLAFYIAPHLFQ